MERGHILIVEDDVSFRESLADVLRGTGYEVMVSSEWREAMSAVERSQPALIILDLMMPGVNGQQLSRLFKQNERTAKVPILALSGAGPEAVLQAEVDWYLSKPVEVATLLSTVRHLVGDPVSAPPARATPQGGASSRR